MHPDTMESRQEPAPRRRYTWPWFVLAAFVLAVVLAGIWLLKEVRRVKRIKSSTKELYGLAVPTAPSESTARPIAPGKVGMVRSPDGRFWMDRSATHRT
jgi:hypothetical protein